MNNQYSRKKDDATEVVIGGKVYRLTGADSAYLQAVASFLNEKLAEVRTAAGYNHMDDEYRHLLLCLNLADEYFKEKKEAEQYQEEAREQESKVINLKHDLVTAKMKLEAALRQQSVVEARSQSWKKRYEELLGQAAAAGILAETEGKTVLRTDAGKQEEKAEKAEHTAKTEQAPLQQHTETKHDEKTVQDGKAEEESEQLHTESQQKQQARERDAREFAENLRYGNALRAATQTESLRTAAETQQFQRTDRVVILPEKDRKPRRRIIPEA